MAGSSTDLDSIIKRRGFLWRSFDIYGGSAGFYDYGPLGAELKNRILSVWRKYFVLREGFAEIDTPNLTPHEVFRASGHLDKFNDVILECANCSSLFKADNLFAAHYSEIASEMTIDGMDTESLDKVVLERKVTCPDCEGTFKPSYEFNLMFKTTVGRDKIAYLHPETAQGIFVNFQNLYGFFREKLPFGAVTVGKGFRNEISPRQGLIRLREFNMAEAEVFIDPASEEYPNFHNIKNTGFTLHDQHGAVHMATASEALEDGLICNKALAYYMAVTQDFLHEVGVDPERMRFRQHQIDEMAHYAEDCWDAEILMEIHGKETWIECVGIANRSCYDLEQHMKATGQDLRAFRKYDEPIEREIMRVQPNLPALGKAFRKDSSVIREQLELLTPPFSEPIIVQLHGADTEVSPDMYTIENVTEKVSGERYIPTVIEPSFGVDRILYAVLQHSYQQGKQRESVDSESYSILRLKPSIAPIQVAVFPLFNKPEMASFAHEINQNLVAQGMKTILDTSGSIGKRYARMDEIGTPFCITVDHRSVEDGTITIRDRDSTIHYRIGTEDVGNTLKSLFSDPDSITQFPET